MRQWHSLLIFLPKMPSVSAREDGMKRSAIPAILDTINLAIWDFHKEKYHEFR
jgi:hypothetical protein